MWVLLRVLAVAVLACVAALVSGRGDLVIRVSARVTEVVGLGPVPGPARTAPGPAVTAVAVAIGTAVGLVGPSARAVRQVVTLVHELGHTVVAAALGARPSGIVLRHDASGHATARWVADPSLVRRPALAAVAAAGIPAATVATLAGAQLQALAGPRPVLWALAAAGLVVTALSRSTWSLLVAVTLVGLALLALRDAAGTWAVGVVVGTLSAVAARAVVDDVRTLRTAIGDGDDARAVSRQLWLPARVVRTLLVAVSAAAGVATLVVATGLAAT